MAHVQVVLERRDGLGVPRDAIQRRASGNVVFAIENDHARMVPVVAGLERDGLVEVTADDLSEADQVVSVGGYFLNADAAVKVVREAQ